MNARTRAIVGVAIMSVLLVLYFVFVGVRAVALLSSDTALAVAMGVALIVLPLIGAWALVQELLFGWRSTKLVDRLEAEDELPGDLGEVTALGRANRDIADLMFGPYKAAAEADSENWRHWARLSIVYDACGDRTRARRAMREAIALSRTKFSDADETE